jgi:hypothetical protein
MTFFEDGPPEGLEEQHTQEYEAWDEERWDEQDETPRPVGVRLSGFKERIGQALASFDRGRVQQLALQPAVRYPDPQEVVDEVMEAEEDRGFRAEDHGPFPVGKMGYDPAAVEARIAELEREIEELRESQPPMSITEELERLGEQTASILVVAHDKAHETTRLAQQQAEQCIADAASNAVAITEQAKQELRELDIETDAVWRERARLLEDARQVGAALIALAEEAGERFPAEGKPAEAREGIT